MAGGVPTVSRRLLGDGIRRLREQSGKTLDEAANAIGKNRVQLIRVIEGKGRISAEDLTVLLGFLGAGAEETQELLALGVEARKRSSRRAYPDQLPKEYFRLADLEALATEIWDYSRGVIPGLLQTPDYIEAEMTYGDGIWWDSSLGWEERRNRIDYRLTRQRQTMESDPSKALRFVIADEALRTEVGAPTTMQAQLAYLLKIIDTRPEVNIQVLSSTVSHNPAPVSGMILLHFEDPLPPMGLMPVSFGPPTYVEAPTDTARLIRAFRKVESLALSRERSRARIAELAASSS